MNLLGEILHIPCKKKKKKLPLHNNNPEFKDLEYNVEKL